MGGTVLIYGGAGGIGAATARALVARGLKVHLAGRTAARLEAVARDIGARFSVADVEDPAGFGAVTADAGDELIGLVYAVGTIQLKPLSRLTSEDALRDFRINALGAAMAVQAAAPVMRALPQPAGVVLFSSVAARQGFAAHASVAMAKGAVEGLTLALAAELAPRIRVNAIAPSLTRTPLAASLTANAQMADAIAGLHALGRLGVPDDIGALAAFLVSPEAGWITGQVIGVDGGRATLRVKG